MAQTKAGCHKITYVARAQKPNRSNITKFERPLQELIRLERERVAKTMLGL